MHRFILLLAAVVALLSYAHAEKLPIITLPWGKYQAQVYEKDDKIYLFKNIRFGSIAERFGPPSFPTTTSSEIQDPNIKTTCYQVNPKKSKNPPGGKSPLGDPGTPFESQTEDCLFLDVYVPKSVFQKPADEPPIPVVNWIYGGGYAFGAKDQGGPLYTGQAMLNQSEYDNIFVAANYRVGAFGWLAGDYMQSVGQPNAGLYDQALALEWIQKYIGQVHGDRGSVTAWGESAGAGSIMHHLIREDGFKDPNFKRFIAQSPGFEWAWDNSKDGKLDTIYRNFSSLAGCGFKYDIDCLRKADPTALGRANQELFDVVRQTGLFPVGPAIDGKWVKSLASVSFASRDYWRGIESGIVSHVANEGYLFTPDNMDAEKYEQFLNEFLPGDKLLDAREAINDTYDCSKYPTYKSCVATLIGHAVFTCNGKTLIDSYPSWAMEYQYPADGLAFHGSDLIPSFTNSYQEALALLLKMDISPLLAPGYAKGLETYIRNKFQKYLASYISFANPNAFVDDDDEVWKSSVTPRDGSVSNTMQVRAPDLINTKAFQSISDKSYYMCTFWTSVAEFVQHSESNNVLSELSEL